MALERRHPGGNRRRRRRRRIALWCTMVLTLLALTSTVVGLQAASGQDLDPASLPTLPPLAPNASVRACEGWARHGVPGLREIHLTGLTPPVARTMVVTDEAVQRIVTRFREMVGGDEIVAELGTYAWYGSSTQPDRAWSETWAEAFSLYWTAPHTLAAPAAQMVAEVLGALGLQ